MSMRRLCFLIVSFFVLSTKYGILANAAPNNVFLSPPAKSLSVIVNKAQNSVTSLTKIIGFAVGYDFSQQDAKCSNGAACIMVGNGGACFPSVFSGNANVPILSQQPSPSMVPFSAVSVPNTCKGTVTVRATPRELVTAWLKNQNAQPKDLCATPSTPNPLKFFVSVEYSKLTATPAFGGGAQFGSEAMTPVTPIQLNVTCN